MRHMKAKEIWQVKPTEPLAGHPGRKFQSSLKKVQGSEKVTVFEKARKHKKHNWRKKDAVAMRRKIRAILAFHPVQTPITRWENDPNAPEVITPNCYKGKGPIGSGIPSGQSKLFGRGMDHESHAQMNAEHEARLGDMS